MGSDIIVDEALVCGIVRVSIGAEVSHRIASPLARSMLLIASVIGAAMWTTSAFSH